MQAISPEGSATFSGVVVEFASEGGWEGPGGEGMMGFSVIILGKNSLSMASSSRDLSSSAVFWLETHVVEGCREGRSRNEKFQEKCGMTADFVSTAVSDGGQQVHPGGLVWPKVKRDEGRREREEAKDGADLAKKKKDRNQEGKWPAS